MKKAKFMEEQIARILQEAASGQTTQTELCRKHGISQNTYYTWKRKYGGMETADVRRLKVLERENAQLKRLLAERDLEVDAAKQLLRPNANPAAAKQNGGALPGAPFCVFEPTPKKNYRWPC